MSGGEVYMGIIPRLEEATFLTMVQTIMGRFASLGTSMEASVSASAVRASQVAVTQAERTLAAQERIEAQAVQATERAEAAIVTKMRAQQVADESAQRGVEQVIIANNNLLTSEERLAAIRDESSVAYEQQLRRVEAMQIRVDQAARNEIATIDAQTAALDAQAAAATRLADARGAQLLASGSTAAAQNGLLAAQRANAATEDGAAMAAASSASMAASVTGIGAVAVALGYATEQAGKFEKQQELLHTTAGMSQDDVGKTGQAILDMAGQVGTSATELSKSMFIIAKSGGPEFDDVGKRLDVLRAAAQGAKEENADLGAVTKGLTTTMHDFHIDDPYEAMSKIKAAAGMGKMSIQEFTTSLASVEPLASALHIPLERLYAEIAQMSQSGMGAERATQMLNNGMQQFLAPSTQMRQELSQLGLDADELKDHLGERGLSGTYQKIFDAMGKVTQNGQVVLDPINQIKDKVKAADIAFATLGDTAKGGSPKIQEFAKEVESGEKKISAIKSSGFTAEMQGRITDYIHLTQAAEGFTQSLKTGQDQDQSVDEVWKRATGTMSGLNDALQLTGKNTDEVNDKTAKLTATTKEGDKQVQGFTATQDTFSFKWDTLKTKLGSVATTIGQDLMPVAKGLLDLFNDIATAAEKVTSAISWFDDKANNIVTRNGADPHANDSLLDKMKLLIFGGGHAEGGLFHGRGTGTSDENLIAISNKEYIVKAAQTAKHLPLLEAINNDEIRGFNTGGYTGDDDPNNPLSPFTHKPWTGAGVQPPAHIEGESRVPILPTPHTQDNSANTLYSGLQSGDSKAGLWPGGVNPSSPAPRTTPQGSWVGLPPGMKAAPNAPADSKPVQAWNTPVPSGSDNSTSASTPSGWSNLENGQLGADATAYPSPQDYPTVDNPASASADDPLNNIGVGHSIQATPLVMNNKTNFGAGTAIDRAMSWINSVLGKPYTYGGLDCSGFISGVYNSLLGKNPLARAFSTTSDFLGLGFEQGSGGIFDIGVNPKPGMSGHMAGTFQGHRIESGGSHNNIMMDGDAVGADNAQFSAHYTLPPSKFNPPATDAAGNPLYDDGTTASPNGSRSSSSSSSTSAEHLMTPKEAAEKAAGIAVDGLFETLGLSDSVFADPNRSLFGKLAGAGNALRFGATYDDAGNMTNPGVGVFGQPMPWDAEYITDSSGNRRKKTNTEQKEGRAAAADQKAQEKTWLDSEKGQADMEGAQKHWDTAKKHLEQAAHSEALAAQTSDPAQKAKHLQAAKHYRDLAAASQAAGDKAAGKGNMLLNPSSPATMAYDPKKGESQWSPLIHWALAHTNLPDADAARTGQQVRIESGGNPRAMSNAYPAGVAGGHPKGLLQVIDSTFASMRDPSLSSDIYDPAANLVAGLNWVTKRWGGPSKKWPTTAGYDEGGWLQPGMTLVDNQTGKPEPVLNPQQKAQLDRAANNQQQGFGGDGAKGLVVIEEMHNHAADGREVGRDIARQFNTFAGGYSR